MTILVGDTRSRRILQKLQAKRWGRMWIDQIPRPYVGEPWGFDNGAFRNWRHGVSFDDSAYMRRLEKAYRVGIPYIAIVPDLVAQGLRSLDFSCQYLDKLPGDWPWYLAVQNGMSEGSVESVIHKFAGILLGGDDSFKTTAHTWSRLAHRHGKKFHYARCGTPRKIRHAQFVEADSLDSAFPLWQIKRLDKVEVILDNRQLFLWQDNK